MGFSPANEDVIAFLIFFLSLIYGSFFSPLNEFLTKKLVV